MSEKNIGFRTSKEQADYLEKLAHSLGVSTSDLIRRALNCGMKEAIQSITSEQKEGAKKALKMVRGAEFESATPTVSKFGTLELIPQFA